MEKQPVEITKMGGLKCDNPECDYENPNIKVEDYKDWINKPCPKCGQSLLTKEDYISFQTLIQSVNLINNLDENTINELTKNIPDDLKDIKAELKVDFNGTGVPNIDIALGE